MIKMLRLKFLFAGLIAVMCLVWAACDSSKSDSGSDSGGGGGDETVFVDGNWRMQSDAYRCTSEDVDDGYCDAVGELVTETFPMEESFDGDGDGTNETITTNIYISLNSGTGRSFNSIDFIDGGTVNDTFADNMAEYGIYEGTYYCSGDDFNYTVTGNTMTDDEGNSTVTVSGDTMTVTNPADSAEKVVFVKITSIPTAAEECGDKASKSQKSPVKRIPHYLLKR